MLEPLDVPNVSEFLSLETRDEDVLSRSLLHSGSLSLQEPLQDPTDPRPGSSTECARGFSEEGEDNPPSPEDAISGLLHLELKIA